MKKNKFLNYNFIDLNSKIWFSLFLFPILRSLRNLRALCVQRPRIRYSNARKS
jgi:hypothetical protein